MALFGPPDVGKLKAKGDIKGLIKALASRDTRNGESVWAAASAALVEIGPPAVEPLLAVLGDNNVRGITMRTLGQIGDGRAVEPLIAALPALDAVDALGQIGDARALEPLIATFSRMGGIVRQNAGRALARIDRDRAVELLLTVALSDPNKETRQAAVTALASMGKRPVEHLISGLGDERASARAAAATALGEIGGRRSIDPLVAALADQDASVRTSAAQALEKRKWHPNSDAAGAGFLIALGQSAKCVKIGAPAVEPLVAALQDQQLWNRSTVAEALGEIGDTTAVEPLVAALADRDDNLRCAAATALGELHDPQALEPLVALLWDQSGQVRSAAGRALGEIRDVRDPRPLVAALGECTTGGDRDALVRNSIVNALGRIGDPAIELLLAALEGDDGVKRAGAAEALDQLGWQPRPDAVGAASWIAKADWARCVEIGAPAVEPLIVVLGDESEAVRKGAAKALGEIRDPRALAPLATMLSDESDDARWVAVNALARFGASAVQPLVGALGDKAPSVRIAATRALGETGEPAVEALIGALAEVSGAARAAACEALGVTGDARALNPLASALKDRDEDVRQAAAGALGNLGGGAVGPLVGALGDGSATLRQAAAGALGAIGDARALVPLLAALNDQSSEVRTTAAWALGATRDNGAVARLIDALDDPVVAVRQAAALALDALDWSPARDAAAATYWIVKEDWGPCIEVGAPALEPLVCALADKREPARRSAAVALGKLANPAAIDALAGALDDRSEGVRLAAAASLDALGWRPAPDAVGAAYCVVKREWAWCVDIGPDALVPLIAALKDRAWAVRKAAAESLLAIHRSGALGEEQKALLLAQREDITRWHVDKRDSFVSSSDCAGHSDKHTDEGIGVAFPL